MVSKNGVEKWCQKMVPENGVKKLCQNIMSKNGVKKHVLENSVKEVSKNNIEKLCGSACRQATSS